MCYKNEYQKRAHGEVEQIFRELLPEAGLHVREEQIRLCHEMLDALMKIEITLCDAGVGIGKTYAYLTACILMRKYSVLHSGYSGCDRRSVVVSTSSIALQKAIIEEYVPFLSDVLLKADLLQGELKAVVRKGKEHFVCDYRLAQRLEAVRDKNKNQAQMEALKSLRHNFDLDSVHNLSGFDRRLVCVPKFCPRECPGKAGCRYQKHLDSSRKEDIFLQICNHNYLLADAMHRANGYRPLLADYRALVVDEAHKLPEAARQMYGRSIGREDVQEIAYFLGREHKGTDGKRLQEGFLALLAEIRKHRKDGTEDMAGKEVFIFAGSWHSLSTDAGKASAYDQKARREHSLLDLPAAGRDGRAVRLVFKERQTVYFVFTAGQPGTFNFYGGQPGDPEVSGCDFMEPGISGDLNQRNLKSRERFCKDQTDDRAGKRNRCPGVCGRIPILLPGELSALHPGAFKTQEKGKPGRGRTACRADP